MLSPANVNNLLGRAVTAHVGAAGNFVRLQLIPSPSAVAGR
jgi:hypothetical protein